MFVAFLRGVNLGRRRIKNTELVACFEALGFEAVSAFLASGNVMFRSRKRATATLETYIERGLKDALNYEVPTFVRNAAEIVAVTDRTRFSDQQFQGRGKLQVALLKRAPSVSAKRTALKLATGEDRLSIHGRELYWLPSGGVSGSELDFRALEAALGPYTVRTARTVERLCAKL